MTVDLAGSLIESLKPPGGIPTRMPLLIKIPPEGGVEAAPRSLRCFGSHASPMLAASEG